MTNGTELVGRQISKAQYGPSNVSNAELATTALGIAAAYFVLVEGLWPLDLPVDELDIWILGDCLPNLFLLQDTIADVTISI